MGKTKDFLIIFFDRKFLKFVLVGLINTAVGTSLTYFASIVLKFSYWPATFFGFAIASIISFFLNKHFSFNVKSKKIIYAIKFVLVLILAYFIAYFLAKEAVIIIFKSLKHNLPEKTTEYIAILCGQILFVGLNYTGQRFFTFRNNSNQIGDKSKDELETDEDE